VSYQSLYRRYRSQSFSEVKGQPDVINALKTAVSENRFGHAYLFSGPRGTGKTSTARVLAKALNCENQKDGEPCNTCESCEAITAGKSFDLHELDAASNNKVDDVRDLISKVHLGSPGRTKVYILDEVHMLSSGAENALLKTLEEPPEHVVFVLATTEPHKVVSTIRSRTQHFKFGLLPADDLEEHIRWVAKDAGFEVTDEIVSHVIQQGGGSARDTLSALDLVLAAGGLPDSINTDQQVLEAISNQNAADCILSVQKGLEHGSEPRTIGESVLSMLRNSFLASMKVPLPHISDQDKTLFEKYSQSIGPAKLTTALETLGSALVDMRQAADPRVCLEVALLKLCKTGTGSVDNSLVNSLAKRVEALENSGPVANPNPVKATPTPAEGNTESSASGPAALARKKLAEVTSKAPPSPRADKPQQEKTVAENKPQTTSPEPTKADNGNSDKTDMSIEEVFNQCLETSAQKVRVRFKGGNIESVAEDIIKFSVPNEIHANRCEEVKEQLEKALSDKLGVKTSIELVVNEKIDLTTIAAPKKKDDINLSDVEIADIGPVSELKDAPDQTNNQVDRITSMFPGSKIIENNTN